MKNFHGVKISSKELEVKLIGTIHNVSDIGTKPLSQQRLKVLLRKCHASMEMATESVRRKDRKLKRERERDATWQGPKFSQSTREDYVCKRPWVSGARNTEAERSR